MHFIESTIIKINLIFILIVRGFFFFVVCLLCLGSWKESPRESANPNADGAACGGAGGDGVLLCSGCCHSSSACLCIITVRAHFQLIFHVTQHNWSLLNMALTFGHDLCETRQEMQRQMLSNWFLTRTYASELNPQLGPKE